MNPLIGTGSRINTKDLVTALKGGIAVTTLASES